jgi:hypothetical protein
MCHTWFGQRRQVREAAKPKLKMLKTAGFFVVGVTCNGGDSLRGRNVGRVREVSLCGKARAGR